MTNEQEVSEMVLRVLASVLALAMPLSLQACHDYREVDGQDQPPIAMAGSIRTPEELAALFPRAKGGDVGAMHTLATHYFGTTDFARAHEWLRRAARLGDCTAIELLLDRALNVGIAQAETAHWNAEWQRLRCEDQEQRP
jgi:hypothetical protein